MQSRLFARSTGELSPDGFAQATASGLVRSFAAAPQHRFDGEGAEPEEEGRHVNLWAHRIGVNALALDKFDGRLYVPPLSTLLFSAALCYLTPDT